MVDADSADVWVRQHQFRLDMSVGAPPDAFSATGQDWGMPVYHWDALAAEDYQWLRMRARRSADLFDGYRVDHLVGFYRTYGRVKNGGDGLLHAVEEPAQRALGETVLELFRGAGAEIIAEDLGTVPDFVRASLARLGIPGYRVFRWERHWHDEGQPFRDPAEYPPLSVAASGTHDTEPVAIWWDQATAEERSQVSQLAVGAAHHRRRRSHAARVRRDGPRRAARSPLRVGVRTCCWCRCRTPSAGAIASTNPARSTTATGPTAYRGSWIRSMMFRKLASGRTRSRGGPNATSDDETSHG